MKKNASSFLLLTLGLLITIILFDYSSLYSQAVKKEKIKYGESKSIVSQRPNKFTKFLKSRVDEGKEKFDEPQMFALINRLMRTKDGSAAPTYKPNYKMTELMKLKQNSFSMKKTQSLNWVERGPGNVGGRTRGIVVDPGDPTKNTWYVG
ncbi:hypothetical protein D9V86_12865, partial [Bacteroidetes/Chlorobi group bacterium ChocPot_Mid]